MRVSTCLVRSSVLRLIAFPIPKDRPAAPPPETLIRLNVQAMAAPKPALRIQLLPELREQKPGNPIPAYLKCLLDQDNTTPESNLGPAALSRRGRAARLEKPDWQVLTQLQKEGFNLLLPDLQKMRELAAGLQARFREEVAQQRFDDAIVTAKTMFALARHTGEHPTIIGDLVGIAIASIAIAPLQEMLEQPGARTSTGHSRTCRIRSSPSRRGWTANGLCSSPSSST